MLQLNILKAYFDLFSKVISIYLIEHYSKQHQSQVGPFYPKYYFSFKTILKPLHHCNHGLTIFMGNSSPWFCVFNFSWTHLEGLDGVRAAPAG